MRSIRGLPCKRAKAPKNNFAIFSFARESVPWRLAIVDGVLETDYWRHGTVARPVYKSLAK